MNDHYILSVSGDPVPEPDIIKWAHWFGASGEERMIARTTFASGVVVSTVFLGLDHSFGHGAPLLYETMIFGGALEGTQDRYTTRQEAINSHAAYVALVDQQEGP